MKRILLAVALSLLPILSAFATPPGTFTEAEIVAKQQVYLDQASSLPFMNPEPRSFACEVLHTSTIAASRR